jgi:Gas vesicle synthesis protein GvpL/GvpF
MAVQDEQAPRAQQRAVYVYGILPGDIELAPGATGVGDPAGEVRVVRNGDLAALVSDVDLDKPLGRPEDLFAHEELLDLAAAEVPVLPLRFGALVSSDDAVAEELLEAHHDEFATALSQLEDRVEYVVRGRYDEQAILREVLAEDPQAARLAEQIKGADPDATRELRIQIGEILNTAVAAKREEDTRVVGDALAGLVEASVVRPPGSELDAVYTAFLVTTDAGQDLSEAVGRLADEWEGRVDLNLIGPLAAYDFVGAPAPTFDPADTGGLT